MNTQNPRNENLEIKAANPGTRLAAWLIELVTPFVIIITSLMLFQLISGGELFRENESSTIETIATNFTLVLLVAYIMLQITLVINRSQTFGKFLLNIQIIKNEQKQKQEIERIGFWSFILLREFIGKTLIIGSIPIIKILFMPIYGLIDNLIIFSKDHRTLHDRIANTRVIILPNRLKRKSLFDFKTLEKTYTIQSYDKHRGNEKNKNLT